MKVVILAGGLGTRLSEYTDSIPKPMVTIGGKPILWHIMETYASFGHNDFYIAAGYKSEVIKEYFLNYKTLNSDFTIDLATGDLTLIQNSSVPWRVTIVDTGASSLTGGRLKRLKTFLEGDNFMLTYGDGLSDVNINQLVDYHLSHGKMVTLTAVRPVARFGDLEMSGDDIIRFSEKTHLREGWINGGFFVIRPDFLDLIEGDLTILEKEPLERAAALGELKAWQHDGFWQCMDTKRDRELLESCFDTGNPPWMIQK